MKKMISLVLLLFCLTVYFDARYLYADSTEKAPDNEILSNPKNGKSYARRIISKGKATMNEEMEIKGMIRLIYAHYFLKETDSAFMYITQLKSMRIDSPVLRLDIVRANAYINIYWHNFNTAIDDLQNHLKNSINIGVRDTSTVFITVAKAYSLAKEYDSAEWYYRKSLSLLTRIGDSVGLLYAQNNYAINFIHQNQYTEAGKVLAIAKKLNSNIHDAQAEAAINYNMSRVYLEANLLDSAAYCLFDKHHSLTSSQRKLFENQYSHLLSNYYEKRNITDSALYYYKRYTVQKDSLYDISAALRIQSLKENGERLRLEQKVTYLDAINSRKNIILLLSVIIFSLLLIMVIQTVRRIKFRNLRLKNDLDHKSRELTTNMLSSAEKTDFIKYLKGRIEQIHANSEGGANKLRELKSKMNTYKVTEAEWERIKLHFEQVHPDFFSKLYQLNPNLTAGEQKLAAYIKLKMSSKEIALLQNNEHRTIQTAKYRLKRKLKLGSGTDLTLFIQGL